MSTVSHQVKFALARSPVPPPVARLQWWLLALPLLAATSVITWKLYPVWPGEHWDDWQLWQSLGPLLLRGQLYANPDPTLPFVWSPVMAVVMVGATVVGYWPWLALHLAALVLLRSPILILATLISYPFWVDATGANTMTFVLVAGVLALRGSQPGAVAYLALCTLMPRPIQLPLAVWLLWKRRDVRRPFAWILIGHALVVLLTGYAWEWIQAMVNYGLTDLANHPHNLAPTQFVGSAWLIIGLPLCVWLTLRGWTGIAGLALSTYILPTYLLVLLWDYVRQFEPIGVDKECPN